MPSSEESTWPEIDEPQVADDSDVYDRFSKTQKNFVVSAVSFSGLLSSAFKLNANHLQVAQLMLILSIQNHFYYFCKAHTQCSSNLQDNFAVIGRSWVECH
jgi:hypothetical protein